METIKLLIWDLDETFWNGTISDGEIEPISENIQLIKNLTDRGIVNSICSKNDFNVAKAKLEELGVWEYFVFPSIDWTNKGVRVKNIISDMQLRPVNCLFIDDNKNNLEEAKFVTPELQTCLPEELKELIKDPAFKGKDDSKHSRLNQYKILEQKAEARSHAASNEEFLFQSNIKVELIEKVDDKLERIHEMIHRNNQLNFTKDRISKEEVDRLFTDPTVKCGVIHVSDNFGDHGIVGCYAVKDGKAVQLVLSCRILGMGVEQWVYSEIGFPELTVVGEVAADLNKTDRPAWINQQKTNETQESSINNDTNSPSLLVYGTCPLRPIWAYIQPKLPNATFAEIDPRPSVLNLAVTLRENEETKKEWLENVKIFDTLRTFDNKLFNVDYLLFTLVYEFEMFKYTNILNGKYFFSKELDSTTAHDNFLKLYTKSKVTIDDIYSEISYLCTNISKKTKILILTIPEVVFPQIGKDGNYKNYIQINKLTEKLESEQKNVKIIDIRKYAKLPSDFFDSTAYHYNRNIGYSLSCDIFNVMGVLQNTNNVYHENFIPSNAIHEEILINKDDNIKVKYTQYILNAQLHIKLEFNKIVKPLIKYEFFRGRYIESSTEFIDETEFVVNSTKSGYWWTRINIKLENSDNTFTINTKYINYSPLNYFSFINENAVNFNEAKESLNFMCNENITANDRFMRICSQIADLAAAGVNVADYFIEKNISELIIYTDKKVGSLIIPFLIRANIKVKEIYTTDFLFSLQTLGDHNIFSQNIKVLNAKPILKESDNLFFAFDYFQDDFIRNYFCNYKCKKFYIHDILDYLMTKTFFVSKYKHLNIIALRTPTSNWWEFSNITPNERASTLIKSEKQAISMLKNNENLPPQFKNIPTEELLETLKTPTFVNKNGVWQFGDVSGKYLNIKNGHRITPNQPSNFRGTIYLIGGSKCFGLGVSDNETIAAHLQKLIGNKYKVENYANCWSPADYSKILSFLDNTEFGFNDIVVFIQSNWRNSMTPRWASYLNWDAMNDSIIQADAFPLFNQQNRPDYFLLPNAYNSECNQEIAKIIKNIINKKINQ